jgi:TetR/AcrR family transcriptional repressor of bet genes
VDHQARREQIAEALWRLAESRGLDRVSLRDVASEAEMSLGQLQHYFNAKNDLLVYAAQHVSDMAECRIRERISEAFAGGRPTPYALLRECLRHMIPLTQRSRSALLVQNAYFNHAVRDPAMRTHAQQGIAKTRAFFADLLRQGIERGDVAADCDVDKEAMLLIATVDGLTSQVLMDVLTPAQAADHLDHRLRHTFAAGGPSGSYGR